jgi:galactose-1-phosphate uridylyltransferase
MTNIELQALRRLFMLTIDEAAKYIASDVSPNQWQAWEQGEESIPDEVVENIQKLRNERKDKVARIIEKINNRIGNNTIRYFMTFEDFHKVNPELNVLSWRLHQSIATELYFRGLETLC